MGFLIQASRGPDLGWGQHLAKPDEHCLTLGSEVSRCLQLCLWTASGWSLVEEQKSEAAGESRRPEHRDRGVPTQSLAGDAHAAVVPKVVVT